MSDAAACQGRARGGGEGEDMRHDERGGATWAGCCGGGYEGFNGSKRWKVVHTWVHLLNHTL